MAKIKNLAITQISQILLAATMMVYGLIPICPAAPPQAPQTALPVTGSSEIIRVFSGKSIVINTPEILKRILITNEEVATALLISPDQVVIHGLKPGSVTFMLWNEDEQLRTFQLQVENDLGPIRGTIGELFPNENIRISQSGGSVILSGVVSTEDVAARAGSVAKSIMPNAVSILTYAPMTQTILLEVKFAEVDRQALRELGLNILSTGALNTPGIVSTGQFPTVSNRSTLSGVIGAPLTGFTSDLELTDFLNIFVFRPDLNLGLAIRALQQRSLLQILAEPNLLALGGKEANFLAGGEFPVPVLQGTQNQSVTIQWKEFGVRLNFTAMPTPEGDINLKVMPEVSSLDYSNAVVLGGFTIPALTTRRAETEVKLKNGQSFAIAGLMDNRVTEIASKVPWLGDVPFLGKLFQSKSFRQNNSELLVTVTPTLVKPLEEGELPPLPEFPAPFLDSNSFDKKQGETPPPQTSDTP